MKARLHQTDNNPVGTGKLIFKNCATAIQKWQTDGGARRSYADLSREIDRQELPSIHPDRLSLIARSIKDATSEQAVTIARVTGESLDYLADIKKKQPINYLLHGDHHGILDKLLEDLQAARGSTRLTKDLIWILKCYAVLSNSGDYEKYAREIDVAIKMAQALKESSPQRTSVTAAGPAHTKTKAKKASKRKTRNTRKQPDKKANRKRIRNNLNKAE